MARRRAPARRPRGPRSPSPCAACAGTRPAAARRALSPRARPRGGRLVARVQAGQGRPEGRGAGGQGAAARCRSALGRRRGAAGRRARAWTWSSVSEIRSPSARRTSGGGNWLTAARKAHGQGPGMGAPGATCFAPKAEPVSPAVGRALIKQVGQCASPLADRPEHTAGSDRTRRPRAFIRAPCSRAAPRGCAGGRTAKRSIQGLPLNRRLLIPRWSRRAGRGAAGRLAVRRACAAGQCGS